MRIFFRNTDKRRLNGPLPLDPETGLYSRNFFLLRLREERERSKRSGRPFSLLVADVEDMVASLNGDARGSVRVHLAKLIEQFHRQARRIDIKGWLDEKRLGILMPETETVGACEVKEKICDRIQLHWPHAERPGLEESLEVYTFSAASPSGNGSSFDENRTGGNGSGSSANGIYEDILNASLTSSVARVTKRIFDIAGSLIGIVLASPLMLIIAVAIKLTSPGPVLFRQERIGFLGRRFVFLKFRSMFVDADHAVHERYVTDLINGRHDTVNQGTEGQPLYKMANDPRITPVGRVLRKTSLDELPQLFNILKGDMSLVGPRPPLPYEVEKYRLWHYGRVFEVKPGLTGLWQVSGRSQTGFDDMVRLDLRYANSWSLWLDLKIILKTFPAVLSAKGAY